MAFLVHRAERADLLVEGLADLLRTPPEDPFATELVIVPARGVERWLSQRLSHRLGTNGENDDGVCAGVDFVSPSSLISAVLGTRDHDPWATDTLVWSVLAVIDASHGEDWCRPLAEHLGYLPMSGDGQGDAQGDAELRRGRRYAVARRIARLFTSYADQRPTLMEEWTAGERTDGAGNPLPDDLAWQAELWRRVRDSVAAEDPVARHARVCAALRADPAATDLPSRISLFGHTRLSVSEVALLRALGEQRDVHLWIPHPSESLWSALADQGGVLPRAEDDSHQRVGHPLTASLGRDLRELQRLLGPGGVAAPVPPRPDTVLGLLQSDLSADRVPNRPRERPADASLSVHACHGPSRQVEVLREVLLGLLADDPTLEPRDVLVMCPDIETYAPLISAAFGLGDVFRHDDGHPGQHLRVHLADRSLTQTNPLLAVMLKVLDIAGGRAEASAVLDLLALPPVRRRFGLSDADLERLTAWVAATGVRWGFDAAHRAEYGLEAYPQNTWQFALDRILTGVAVSGDAARWFEQTLPLDDVSSSEVDLAGRLAEFVERLQRIADELDGPRSVSDWTSALAEGVAALTSVGRDDEWQSGQVQRELAAISTAAVDDTELRLADVRALLAERFTGRPTRANFRTGTLTVCTMTPMRSVPHRVVVLLGLDDGVFPRAGFTDGDDVLARRPLTGERDPRSEDRQLLLDAVLAATDHLVVTYTGMNETTGQRRPPSVPLQELLDALDRTIADGAAAVTTRHPLQAFDRGNLTGPVPFSFDRQALAGAVAAAGAPVARARLLDLRLSSSGDDIELADLLAFFKAPGKQFLRKRLGLALPDEDEATTETIPVEIDSLVEWSVGERLLRDLRTGTLAEALQHEWRRGVLPPGRLGWRVAQRIGGEAEAIAQLVDATVQDRQPRAFDVDLVAAGRRLVGAVTDVYGDMVLSAGYSRVGAKQELDAWIRMVVLAASRQGSWSGVVIGRGRKGQGPRRVLLRRPEDPQAVLDDLVALYEDGMSSALPLPVKTARAYAECRLRRPDQAARFEAGKEWSPRNWDGENAEPAHTILYGAKANLDVLLDPVRPDDGPGEHRLDALSARLWRPLLAARADR